MIQSPHRPSLLCPSALLPKDKGNLISTLFIWACGAGNFGNQMFTEKGNFAQSHIFVKCVQYGSTISCWSVDNKQSNKKANVVQDLSQDTSPNLPRRRSASRYSAIVRRKDLKVWRKRGMATWKISEARDLRWEVQGDSSENKGSGEASDRRWRKRKGQGPDHAGCWRPRQSLQMNRHTRFPYRQMVYLRKYTPMKQASQTWLAPRSKNASIRGSSNGALLCI